MTELAGTSDSRFDPLCEALAQNIANGTEVGASLVVNIDGTNVVDVWGGWRDAARTVPWTEDTLVNVCSTTKTLSSLAALVLVDRGWIDVRAPVSRYWPEFAQNGKADVEVRHVLSHSSGVSAWAQPFAPEDSYDLAASTAQLATQPTWWEPGTASCYHASTFGHLIGELVRRTTGLGLREFVEQEITGPLGADFQIGVREEDWHRVAEIIPPPAAAPAPDDADTSQAVDESSPAYKTFAGSLVDPGLANTPDWRRMVNGAVNGHSNARGVAAALSVLALGGEAGGVRLLSPATIELAFEEQVAGVDLFLGLPLRWGIGYGLRSEGVPFIHNDRTLFWGGWGGSLIIADLEHRMTISYMMNQMQPGVIGSDVSAAYVDAVYDCLAPTAAGR